MASNEELLLKVRAETDKATAEIKRLTREVDALTKKTKGSTSSLKDQKSAFDGISKSTSGVASAFNKITLGLGALGVAVKGVEFAKLAADAEQSADAFEKVVTDMGYIAEEEFNKIKEASKGLLSDADIKQSATAALSLGVPLEQLSGLMEVARAKAREMGIDTKQAFSDLVGGVAKGSFELLNNLGITIKVGEENKKYADSIGKTVEQLTAQDKIQAIAVATLEKGADSVKRFADAGLSSKERMQEMNASIDNLKVNIGEKLLPVLEEFTEKTTDWVNSISEEDLNEFGSVIDSIATSIGGLVSAVQILNDVGMPDWLFGDGSTILSETARQIQNISDTFQVWEEAIDSLINASDELESQSSMYDAIAEKVRNFAGTSEDFDMLERSTKKAIESASELHTKWTNAKNPEAYKEQIAGIEEVLKGLGDEYSNLTLKKPFDTTIDSAKLAEDAVKSLTQATKTYTEAEIKDLKKLNDQRVKDAQGSIKSLESSEKKLANDIVKINQDLVKQLSSIANDRFKMNQDIESKIADLKRGALSEDAAYYDKQKEAEQALSDAKIALKQGEYEKYKYFIDQYQSLVTDSAGQEIKIGERVAVTKEETRRRAIDGLEKIKNLENAYYNQQESDARAAHDAAVQQKKIELDATIALMEAQKASLELMKQLAEEITGKKLDIDTSAVDASIEKAKALKLELDNVQNSQTRVNVDSTTVDVAKQNIEQLKTLTLNGVTLEVDADTKPADFGIKKLITGSEGEEITMDVNPEYEKAQKELDAFRNGESGDSVIVGVDANTAAADAKIGTLKQPTDSQHTVKPNANSVISTINKLKQPTSSVHTIYERVVSTRANGGPIPQRLATGGTFRGSGRVPGYDATDSDKVNALLTGGEFVIRRKAVDAIGAKYLHDLNNLRVPKLPGYATGGLVGGSTSSSASPALQPINLNIGGQSFGVMSDRDVATALQRFINSEGGL